MTNQATQTQEHGSNYGAQLMACAHAHENTHGKLSQKQVAAIEHIAKVGDYLTMMFNAAADPNHPLHTVAEHDLYRKIISHTETDDVFSGFGSSDPSKAGYMAAGYLLVSAALKGNKGDIYDVMESLEERCRSEGADHNCLLFAQLIQYAEQHGMDTENWRADLAKVTTVDEDGRVKPSEYAMTWQARYLLSATKNDQYDEVLKNLQSIKDTAPKSDKEVDQAHLIDVFAASNRRYQYADFAGDLMAFESAPGFTLDKTKAIVMAHLANEYEAVLAGNSALIKKHIPASP